MELQNEETGIEVPKIPDQPKVMQQGAEPLTVTDSPLGLSVQIEAAYQSMSQEEVKKVLLSMAERIEALEAK